MKVRQQGFTLIEVMIVVTVLGILASIAYPSYQQYLARGYRTEARALISELAQQAEQLYSARGDYRLFARCPAAAPCPAGDRGGDALYTVRFDASGAHGFEVRATPTARFQAGWPGDDCVGATLVLSQSGAQTVTGVAEGDVGRLAQTCWRS